MINLQQDSEDLNQLRDFLVEHFSIDELKDICFDLRIDYEVLPGDSKSTKARELVVYAKRRGAVNSLIKVVQKYRPVALFSSQVNITVGTNIEFPYKNWTEINKSNWHNKIAEWFKINYEPYPDKTMSQLLDYLFDVIRHTYPAKVPLNKVMDLGKLLKSYLSSSETDSVRGRDKRILSLIELGLHRQHSHLFMLPQVYKSNLLGIDEYSSLLLATKLQAMGSYNMSQRLVQSLSRGCPLAQYIIAQDYRKQGVYQLAQIHLDEGLKELKNWQAHKCPFNWEFKVICNELTLSAAIFRGKGVIYRKEKNEQKAEEAYAQAELLINRAIVSTNSYTNKNQESMVLPDDAIWTDYDVTSLHLVKADVCFSHGYYWYSQKDYTKAYRLFTEAIQALKNANEGWDSPYTRLAIIQLCQGDFVSAIETFTKAYFLCINTPIERNREAVLSKALCQLGLNIIEICSPNTIGHLRLADPMADLEEALALDPKLTIGPLECHRDDAQHFLIEILKPAHKLVNRFIQRLESEISKM